MALSRVTSFTWPTWSKPTCWLAPRPAAAGKVINIGSGDRCSLLDLVDWLRRLLDAPDLPVIHKPARAGDVLHSSGDISRAIELLGYQPEVSFSSGLERTIDFFRSPDLF